MSDAAAGATANTGGGESASAAAETNTTPSATEGAAPEQSSAAAESPSDTSGTAPTQAETQQAAANLLELVVDGKTVKKTLDEVRKLAQRGLSADQKYEQAAEMKRRVQAIGKKLGSDAIVRAYLSGNEDAFLAAVADRLEYSTLPPEERRKRDEARTMREKADRYDEYEKREREQRERTQRAQDTEMHLTQYRQDAERSLTAAGVEVDPYAIERWAGEMLSAIEDGQPIDAAEAARRVASRVGEVNAKALNRLAKLDGPALLAELDRLGITAKVRSADVARLEQTRSQGRLSNSAKPSGTPSGKPKKEVSTAAYMRALQRGEDPNDLFED